MDLSPFIPFIPVYPENALPALKERCDLVTQGDHGRGVIELVDALVADDLPRLGPRRPRGTSGAWPLGRIDRD